MTDEHIDEQALLKSIEPKSDQLNFDDVAAANIILTVTGVPELKEDIKQPWALTSKGRHPYKPCLTMRRVIIAVWGTKVREWIGRRIELYGDAAVKFGPETPGGIRIAAMSHIDKPVTVKITVSRGKRINFTVQPLKDAAPEPTKAQRLVTFLAGKGKTEQDAVDLIGKPLADASEDDWKTIGEWANGLNEQG